MKKPLLFLVGLIFLINEMVSQSDKQWLIWNGLGKDTLNAAGANNYDPANVINYDFTLMNVMPADRVAIPNAKNDLFIIYSDGFHFNSRVIHTPVYFYTQTDISPTDTIRKHHFNKNMNSGNGKVNYLYLTNRYEEDDPPPKVRAMSGKIGAPPKTYPIDTTKSNMISANHAVVLNKDITLIINYDSLRAFKTIKDYQEQTYSLAFDGLQRVTNPEVGSVASPIGPLTRGNNVLDPRPIFGTTLTALSPVWNNPTPAISGERIVLSPGTSRYGYVNLRKPSSGFGPYSDGDPQYYAVFTLEKNGETVRQLAEPIRASHDPNYLEVKSICQADDDSYMVTYHLEFENTSPDAADSLSAEVIFPTQFDPSCFRVIKWSAAGNHSGHTNISGNTCTFIFGGRGIFHHRTQRWKGIGYVEFEVKFNAGIDLSDTTNSLRLNTPTVFFDGNPFPIEDFRDLMECSIEGMEGSINPESPNEDKSDKSKKSEDEDKSRDLDLSNDMGYMIMEPLPEGGRLVCYRPIIQEDCGCKPFCWVCLLAGFALVALVIVYLKWKRRKPLPAPPTIKEPPRPNI